jgi:hypothetical protein
MTAVPVTPETRSSWSRRLDVVYHAFLAGLLLALGIILVWRPLYASLDFWGHAGIGRWIWQNGHVPDRTLFLWSADEPWVYHSWLTQLLFYGLTNIGTPRALPYVVLVLTTLVALLPFVLALLLCRREGRPGSWMAIPVLVALQGLEPVLVTRPELFTALCLTLLLMFLVVWRRAPDPAQPLRLTRWDRLGLVALFLLFVLWANLHGAVVLGLLVLAVTAVCDLLQDRFNPRARALTVLALLAPVAVCVNPYGLSYWRALQSVSSYTFEHILEWLPVWQDPPLLPEMATAALVLGPLALASWLLNPNRRWACLGWLLLMGLLFMQARRNIWPFSLTCLMVLAANARALDPDILWQKVSRFVSRSSPKQPPPLPDLLRWPARVVLLAWIVLEAVPVIMPLRPWASLYPARLEQGAMRFIKEHQLEGRLFNDFENSSYVQWCLAGEPLLYIDFTNAYPDSVMQDYHHIVLLTNRGRRLLDELEIGIVVLTTDRPGHSLAPLGSYLDANPRWARVYGGRDGAVWVRRSPEYRDVWGPLGPSVNRVEFAVLERWGKEQQDLVPAIAEDHGRGKPPEAKPGPRTRPRP